MSGWTLGDDPGEKPRDDDDDDDAEGDMDDFENRLRAMKGLPPKIRRSPDPGQSGRRQAGAAGAPAPSLPQPERRGVSYGESGPENSRAVEIQGNENDSRSWLWARRAGGIEVRRTAPTDLIRRQAAELELEGWTVLYGTASPRIL